MQFNIPSAEDIESAARDAGTTVTALCRDASVSRSVFTRWKSGGGDPTFDTVRRLIAALEARAAQRQDKAA